MDARGCVSVAPELLIFSCPCRRDRCAHRVAPPSIRSRGVAARVCSVTRAELDKDPNDVRRMFDAVARRYDITNDVLSMGQDRRWRKDVIRAVDPQPGEMNLDLEHGSAACRARVGKYA